MTNPLIVETLHKLGFTTKETQDNLWTWYVTHPKYNFSETYRVLTVEDVMDDFAQNAYRAGEDSMKSRW